MATYKEAEDLINIGAYSEGSNGKIDFAISQIDRIRDFLRQGMDEAVTMEDTLEQLSGLIQDRRKGGR